MDRRIDRHPVTVADILCESTNQVAALAGVQLGRQSQLILPRYLGVLTLLRCLGRVPQRRSVLRPLRAFRHDDERILNPAPSRVVVHQAVALVFERSEEHTSELQSLMRISYAVFCLKKKTNSLRTTHYQAYTL